MQTNLDPTAGMEYRSASQWARRVTESWASKELYCWACDSPRLATHANNMAVEDFQCARCQRRIQLKAVNGRIGRTVSNSAFENKIRAIRANRAPDYAFMSYDKANLRVDALFVVPGPFLSESVVSARKPLRPTARRAGWIGSNIHLDRIPNLAKIEVVADGTARPPRHVRADFARVAFAAQLPANARGWLGDVLACMDEAGVAEGHDFELRDMYAFEDVLGRLHPDNHNVQAKIRQQLQVLERRGLVRRVRRGRYVKL